MLWDAIDRVLGLAEPPTAICFGNDRMAVRAYGILRSRGLSLPADISLAGYDNYRIITENLLPTLTSVELPYMAMGLRAGDLLLAMIRGEAHSEPSPHLVGGPVVWRDFGRPARHESHDNLVSWEESLMKNITMLAGSVAVAIALAGAASAQTELGLWYHGGGNEVESKIINQIVADFNASQQRLEGHARELPASELQRQRRGRGAGRRTCPTSWTWTGRSCRTGPGRGTCSRSASTRRRSRTSCPTTVGQVGRPRSTPSVCGRRRSR